MVLETPDYKLSVKRGLSAAPAPQEAPPSPSGPRPELPAPAAPTDLISPAAAPTPVTPTPAAPASTLIEVAAPIVGTFYASPSPDAPLFVRVGDRVQAGAVLCIIEAMKLMNEIEAEVSGVVREILVRNEEPVEYGQALFRLEPV